MVLFTFNPCLQSLDGIVPFADTFGKSSLVRRQLQRCACKELATVDRDTSENLREENYRSEAGTGNAMGFVYWHAANNPRWA